MYRCLSELAAVSKLFNAIVDYSLPDIFLYTPIPKGRNVNLSDSSKYRYIALSSLYMYGQLVDNAVLMYFSCKLAAICSSDLKLNILRVSALLFRKSR